MQSFASWQLFETYEYQYAGILMCELIGGHCHLHWCRLRVAPESPLRTFE